MKQMIRGSKWLIEVTMLRSMVARMRHAPEKAESDFQALQGLRHEAAQCENAKVVEALGSAYSSGQLCPKYHSELNAALTKYTLAVEQCANAQLAATAHLPEIDSFGTVPEIDFNSWEFTGDIAPSPNPQPMFGAEMIGARAYTPYSKILPASQKEEAKTRVKKQDQRVLYLGQKVTIVEEAHRKYKEKVQPDLEKLAEARSAKQKACESQC